MPFPDKRQHRIALDQARQMCRNHRAAGRGAGPLRAGAFQREVLDAILAQEGCAGVRIYLARTDGGDQTLVMIGLDADGRDMESGTIADDVYPCPPFCTDGGTLDA
ncbi:MAG: hypothetical protein ACRENB_07215 [Gemmatimonadales bacterium]